MTARISPINPSTAEGHAQELFQGVKSKIGMVPNLFKTMGHSPALLEGFLGLNGALARGALPARIREQLALAISQTNRCDYCLSAHTLTGKLAGLRPEEIVAARRGKSEDPKAQAALTLQQNLLESRGDVSDEQLAAARRGGLSDAELVEIVGSVAVMTLTNFLNQLAHTDVDFPRVPLEL